MHPELLHLEGVTLPTYGMLLASGFLASLLLVRRLAPRLGMGSAEISRLAAWLVLGGVAGSRLLYVLTVSPGAPEGLGGEAVAVWRGGHVWYGGLFGGVAVLLWFRWRSGVSLWDLGDAFIPGACLAHAFGRLGCFAAGCCWGRPTELPWAVAFPEGSACGLPGIPLHPVQLYEAAGELAILAGLLALWARRRFSGQVFLAYLVAYPVLRLAVEPLRGDPARGFVLPGVVSIAQAVSAALLVAALLALRLRRRAVPSPA